jgi:hypothetical protein
MAPRRLAGQSAIAAGLFFAAQGAFLLEEPRQDHWTSSDNLAYGLFGVAVVLSLVSIVALGRSTVRSPDRLGRTGLIVSVVGLACLAATALIRIEVSDEVLDGPFLLGFLMIAVGYLLVGLWAYRSRALSLWSAFLPWLGVVGAATLQDAHGAGLWMGLMWLLFGGVLLGLMPQSNRGQVSNQPS